MIEFEKAAKVRGFELVNDYGVIPIRGTSKSAGYDFFSTITVDIHPMEMVEIHTGVTAYMPDNEWLDMRMRSGLSRKKLILTNGAGVVDTDYYPREIAFFLMNLSESDIHIDKGDRIGQGIFSEYKLVDNDKYLNDYRAGGFGHTGK